MAELGKYCKAFLVQKLREFPNWEENLQNLRKEKKMENGIEVKIERTELKKNDILYLQENYVVTDGIFKDEHIIFDKVDDDWKTFCQQILEFR